MSTSEKLMMGMVTLWEPSMSSCGRTLKCSTATRKDTGSHGDQRTPTLLCGCGSSSTTILRSAHRKSLHHWPHLLRLLRILEGSRSQRYTSWNGGMPEPVFDRTCCNDPHNLSAGAWPLWRAAWRGGDRQSGLERQHIQRSLDCGASTLNRQLGGSSSVALKPRNQ